MLCDVVLPADVEDSVGEPRCVLGLEIGRSVGYCSEPVCVLSLLRAHYLLGSSPVPALDTTCLARSPVLALDTTCLARGPVLALDITCLAQNICCSVVCVQRQLVTVHRGLWHLSRSVTP